MNKKLPDPNSKSSIARAKREAKVSLKIGHHRSIPDTAGQRDITTNQDRRHELYDVDGLFAKAYKLWEIKRGYYQGSCSGRRSIA